MQWFQSIGRTSWATCPITENGFIRIASHPSYPNRPGDASAVTAFLRRFCRDINHCFWSDDVSLMDDSLFHWDHLVTHAQVTDLYLLALARHHGGKLATFDH